MRTRVSAEPRKTTLAQLRGPSRDRAHSPADASAQRERLGAHGGVFSPWKGSGSCVTLLRVPREAQSPSFFGLSGRVSGNPRGASPERCRLRKGGAGHRRGRISHGRRGRAVTSGCWSVGPAMGRPRQSPTRTDRDTRQTVHRHVWPWTPGPDRQTETLRAMPGVPLGVGEGCEPRGRPQQVHHVTLCTPPRVGHLWAVGGGSQHSLGLCVHREAPLGDLRTLSSEAAGLEGHQSSLGLHHPPSLRPSRQRPILWQVCARSRWCPIQDC